MDKKIENENLEKKREYWRKKYDKYTTNHLFNIMPRYRIDMEFTDDYSYVSRKEMIERLISEKVPSGRLK